MLDDSWRFNNGVLCCGTLRIAAESFDTTPPNEFKKDLFEWICNTLNTQEKIDKVYNRIELLSNDEKSERLELQLDLYFKYFETNRDLYDVLENTYSLETINKIYPKLARSIERLHNSLNECTNIMTEGLKINEDGDLLINEYDPILIKQLQSSIKEL
jgi:hypothetical protein